MKIDKKNNIIIFDNDSEFEEFAIEPKLITKKMTIGNNQEIYYTDFEFSKYYNDAIDAGIQFSIKDPNSRIMKNGDISYRLITKNISNLIYG